MAPVSRATGPRQFPLRPYSRTQLVCAPFLVRSSALLGAPALVRRTSRTCVLLLNLFLLRLVQLLQHLDMPVGL